MSAVPGRRRTPSSLDPKLLLSAWVLPDIKVKASRAADAAGISLVRYLQLLIDRDPVDENGCPVWLPPAPTKEEDELPRKTA